MWLAAYLLGGVLASGGRVLEVGCGPGRGSALLRRFGAREVVGLDENPEDIALARRHDLTGLSFEVGALPQWQPAAASFDLILCLRLAPLGQSLNSELAALDRLLSPAGVLLLGNAAWARPGEPPIDSTASAWTELCRLAALRYHRTVPLSNAALQSWLWNTDVPEDAFQQHPAAQAFSPGRAETEPDETLLMLASPGDDIGLPPHSAVEEALRRLFSQSARRRPDLAEVQPPGAERAATHPLAESGLWPRNLARPGTTRDAAADHYRRTAAVLRQQLDAVVHSRTWQLMLACRQAPRSFRNALGFPRRVWQILTRPPGEPPEKLSGSAPPPYHAPCRKSKLKGWPKDRPLVTIGVRYSNYGSFVHETVESLLESTLQDFEIVVIDDASTMPESRQALSELRGPRLRVIHEDLSSRSEAWNRVAAAAAGKYIVALEAGERVDPTYLEKALYLLEHSPECGFCYPHVQMFGEATGIWQVEDFTVEKALRQNLVPAGAVFRREAWVEADGFRGFGEFAAWNFWITLAAAGWRACRTPEALLLYSAHQTAMSGPLGDELRQQSAARIRSAHPHLVPADSQGAPADPREAGRNSEHARPLGQSHDPVIRKAMDEYRPPAGESSDFRPFEQREFLRFNRDRPAVLFAVPWMAPGGAEQVVLQVMQGLAAEFALTVASTLDDSHAWTSDFRKITPWVYHLAHLRPNNTAGGLRELVEAHGVQAVIISSSKAGYEALPALRSSSGPWTADIVHNTVPQGYLATSIQFDPYLDQHFAVGGRQAEALRQKVAAGKVQLIPNAVDAQNRFNPETYRPRLAEIRRHLGLDAGETVLTYVGRLAVEKDVPLFVKAVAEIVRRWPQRRVRALIVGDGPERLRVEQEIEARGLRHVAGILGFSANVPDILAASHYAFLTSLFEGNSITLLEAMSMRLVAIAADLGGVREVIEDSTNGFVVPRRDPAEFASCFDRIERDPALQTRIRDAARRTVLERFEISALQRQYAEAIRRGITAREISRTAGKQH